MIKLIHVGAYLNNRRCHYGLVANEKLQDEDFPMRVASLICSLKNKKEALIREMNTFQRKVVDLENIMI